MVKHGGYVAAMIRPVVYNVKQNLLSAHGTVASPDKLKIHHFTENEVLQVISVVHIPVVYLALFCPHGLKRR